MSPMAKGRYLVGILALCALVPGTPPHSSPPAARVLACPAVRVTSASAPGGQSPAWDLPSVPGDLSGVAARSPGSALAVGVTYPRQRPLLAQWNGAAWRMLGDPALPVKGELFGAAYFAGGAWAVGERGMAGNGRGSFPLMMRVTGTTVREVPIPRTTYGGILKAVAATSARNAWAVGNVATIGGGTGVALILHWNGRAWTRARLPARLAREDGAVTGVAATSAANAWVVTNSLFGGGSLPPILHWNGRQWAKVPSPDLGMSYGLSAVAATSARDIFAVGYTPRFSARSLLLHWNGRRWACAFAVQTVRSKVPGVTLNSVSASSPGNAWAVGSYFGSADRAVALHWNGRAWRQVRTRQPGQSDALQGVAVVPRSGAAWAVGTTVSRTLMSHWNGTAWQ
ncbi:MAG: hypothetical protein M0030_21255 [Actinomycetota bacterium]|nr:hypothetical protein [Actinomycetota bacterium]